MASRPFPRVESELFNVHGLYHKVNLDVDARAGFSNVKLNQIGVQDDLDDNTYEYARRYFAMTDFAGGLSSLTVLNPGLLKQIPYVRWTSVLLR